MRGSGKIRLLDPLVILQLAPAFLVGSPELGNKGLDILPIFIQRFITADKRLFLQSQLQDIFKTGKEIGDTPFYPPRLERREKRLL